MLNQKKKIDEMYKESNIESHKELNKESNRESRD